MRTPHELLRGEGRAAEWLVLGFYRGIDGGNTSPSLTKEMKEVASGFLHLTWDLTGGSKDRRQALEWIARDGVVPGWDKHFGDHERSLKSDLVAQNGADLVAKAAAAALLQAGIGLSL